MAASATYTFTGSGLLPSRPNPPADTAAVKLAAGSYAKGTVIGQRSTVTAANDVQTFTITGTPTGGTLRFGFNGEVTAAFTYSTTDATVQANAQAALEALTSIGTGNVTVVSSSSGTVLAVTFGGACGNLEQPALSMVANGLTGGSSPTGTWARTTRGRAAGGSWAAYDDSIADGRDVARAVVQYATTVDTFGKHSSGGGEWGTSQLSAPAFYTGVFYTADLTGIDANGVADLGKLLTGTTSLLSNAATEIRIGV
jgi:hypothetical protein